MAAAALCEFHQPFGPALFALGHDPPCSGGQFHRDTCDALLRALGAAKGDHRAARTLGPPFHQPARHPGASLAKHEMLGKERRADGFRRDFRRRRPICQTDLPQRIGQFGARVGFKQHAAGLICDAGQGLDLDPGQAKAYHMGADVNSFGGEFGGQCTGIAAAGFQPVGDKDDIGRLSRRRDLAPRQRKAVGQGRHAARHQRAQAILQRAGGGLTHRHHHLDIGAIAAPVVAICDDRKGDGAVAGERQLLAMPFGRTWKADWRP